MKFFAFAVTALAAMPCVLAVAKENKGGENKKSYDVTNKNYQEVEQQKADVSKNAEKCPKPEPLTEKFVCEKLNEFASAADFIYDLVEVLKCGSDNNHCWEPVRRAIYELEFELDIFDKSIDESDLHKCFACRDESKIACCYRRYAESIIRLLVLLAEKVETLDGETAFYIVTAVNSLRAADYTFVYELIRRMHCEPYMFEIFEKQGAVDGTTPGSIRAAFSLFVYTPVMADEFLTHQSNEPLDSDVEIIEEIKCKNNDCGGGRKGRKGKKGKNHRHKKPTRA